MRSTFFFDYLQSSDDPALLATIRITRNNTQSTLFPYGSRVFYFLTHRLVLRAPSGIFQTYRSIFIVYQTITDVLIVEINCENSSFQSSVWKVKVRSSSTSTGKLFSLYTNKLSSFSCEAKIYDSLHYSS